MNNPKIDSYSEFFLDEEQTMPKPYDEISRTNTWKNMQGEERLEFIHKHIDPKYFLQWKKKMFKPQTEYIPKIKDELPDLTEPSNDYKQDVRFKIVTNKPSRDQVNWSLAYEKLLREKVYFQLKYELQKQGGSRRKIRALEEMLHNLNLLQAFDTESHIMIDMINEEIDFWKKRDESEEDLTTIEVEKKIKWKASPSIFGFLINELINNNYLEPPFKGGQYNYTGLAKLLYKYFEIETTQDNLIKELHPNKTTLSDTKKAKFTIPKASDLQ